MRVKPTAIRRPRRPVLTGSVLVLLVFAVGFAFAGDSEFSAERFFSRFVVAPVPAEPEAVKETSDAPDGSFTFRDLDIHPDNIHRSFTTIPRLAFAGDSVAGKVSGAYRDLLSVYTLRQGVDDNFTLRVIDTQTGGLLKLVTLDSLRNQYENFGFIDWKTVDLARRNRTAHLVDSLDSAGIERKHIAVKWGRRNQVLEARQREEPFIEYEVQLARYFDLSLLATEIGTVETFNMDHVVSRVGARSRYQLMPSVLRDFGVHHFKLPTKAGRSVNVFEERHPLLTMEVSMIIVRAYSNAVGHEIPGISAYHTGPFNIFKIYRSFLEDEHGGLNRNATTELAYLWGLTEGFPKISRSTSFKGYSRGYIPTGYGSLRATHDVPVDTSLTLLTERVQLRKGKEIYLSELLAAIDSLGVEPDWRQSDDDSTSYLKFKSLNNHLVLPKTENGYTPPQGDILLSSSVRGRDVRFFLPSGVARELSESGNDLFDPDETFSYTHDTFGKRLAKEPTIWDREYDALVADAHRFGFTEENRQRLFDLAEKFEELVEINPSYYRKSQLAVIEQHRWVWRSRHFETLLESVNEARTNVNKRIALPIIDSLPTLTPRPVGPPLPEVP